MIVREGYGPQLAEHSDACRVQDGVASCSWITENESTEKSTQKPQAHGTAHYCTGLSLDALGTCRISP